MTEKIKKDEISGYDLITGLLRSSTSYYISGLKEEALAAYIRIRDRFLLRKVAKPNFEQDEMTLLLTIMASYLSAAPLSSSPLIIFTIYHDAWLADEQKDGVVLCKAAFEAALKHYDSMCPMPLIIAATGMRRVDPNFVLPDKITEEEVQQFEKKLKEYEREVGLRD